MTKYRNKPVEVDAIQWTGSNIQDVSSFLASNVSPMSGMYIEYVSGSATTITVDAGASNAAVATAAINDWFVCSGGNVGAMKPDVFAATYDPET